MSVLTRRNDRPLSKRSLPWASLRVIGLLKLWITFCFPVRCSTKILHLALNRTLKRIHISLRLLSLNKLQNLLLVPSAELFLPQVGSQLCQCKREKHLQTALTTGSLPSSRTSLTWSMASPQPWLHQTRQPLLGLFGSHERLSQIS